MVSVRDPVCGMSVETEKAPAHGVYQGKPVYFCSGGCKKKYDLTHTPD